MGPIVSSVTYTFGEGSFHVRVTGLLLATTLLASVLAPGVVAQDPDSIPPDSIVRILPELTVNVAKPALTSGGSSSVVISLDSLGPIPAPTMEQVLRAMPLIQIRRNSRGEMQPALRGSEDRQIAILMDGVPLTIGWDHRSDMSIIPLTAAQNVTLVRGLSSVLYGPNTLGGVVEVDVARARSRVGAVDPVAFGLSMDQTGGATLSFSGGHLVDERNHQWVFRGGMGFEDRSGVPVSGSAQNDQALRPNFLSDGDLRLNSDVRRFDAFANARYRADEGVWGALSASGYDVSRGVPPEAHQSDPRLWRYPEQRRLIAALSGGTGPRYTESGEWDVEGSVGVDVGSTFIEQFSSETYEEVEETEAGDDRTVTLRALAEHTVGEVGDVRAALTYADVHHGEVIAEVGADPSTLENDYRQRLWSAALETEFRFAPLTLNVGVSYDGSDTPETGDKPALDPISDYGVRVGTSALVADGVLVHAGMSRRSRFPSLRELYSGALGRFEPNPGLRPETLVGTEAGITASIAPGEVQLVGFHHRLTDGIVRRSVTGSDGVRRFQRVNQDEVQSTGAELLVVGTVHGVTLSGDLTVQDAFGVGPSGEEVPLEYEPTITGKFGLNIPLHGGIHVGSEVRYMGEQLCENPEAGGLQPLASSRILDLRARRLFGLRGGRTLSRLDASVALLNVTDASVFDQCGLPQPGRLFQIQFRIW